MVEGIHPSGQGRCAFRIPKPVIDHFQRNGPAHRFFDVLIIPFILDSPQFIFEGLGRDGHGGSVCYAGIPSHRYQDHDIQVPPYPGMIFLVFANRFHVIFEWRWEKLDSATGQPFDSTKRFTKLLWKP